jgi:tripartite-type tricarboxylate transporter receptor subunit TctC
MTPQRAQKTPQRAQNRSQSRLRSLIPIPILAALAVLAGSCAPALAQSWPERPVTMVIPFAAGGAVDVMGRILAARLTEILGQRVIIENVGGAGGMNGANRVAKAAADGYQFVLGGTGTFAANQTLYKSPLYNALTDFTPVVLVAQQPMALIARKDLPAENFQQFVAYAKANQAKMQFGSGGAGSATHLACVLLDSVIGVDVTHVPYRSATIAIQDMIGGRIDYVCPITSTALSLIESKQVKAIAILSKDRAPILPDLASAHEQGLTGFDAYIWNGIFLPKDTPAAIVKKLHDATVEAMNTPAVQERIKALGGAVTAPERRSPDHLRGFVDAEIKKWAAPIKASGISMD